MRLQWIGRASIVLGTVSLVRLISEMLLLWTWRNRAAPAGFVPLDTFVAALWVAGGLFLLSRHSWALRVTAMAAGATAAHTILSILLLGPDLTAIIWESWEPPSVDRTLALGISRTLAFGIELLYWPFVLFALFQAPEARRPSAELLTGSAFAGAGVLTAIIHVTILAALP